MVVFLFHLLVWWQRNWAVRSDRDWLWEARLLWGISAMRQDQRHVPDTAVLIGLAEDPVMRHLRVCGVGAATITALVAVAYE